MKIKKVSELAKLAGVKCLIYGISGSGKTSSLATLPNLSRTLIASAESGLLSLAERGAGMDVAEIGCPDDLRGIYAFLTESEDAKKYDSVALDSLTEMAQQILAEELSNSKDGRKAYGEMNNRVSRIVRLFRDLPNRNVILICQQEKQADESGKIFYGPSMPGKTVSQALPYYFDLVACQRVRTEADGTVLRSFQFASTDEMHIAKDRSGKLDQFEECDWSKIFNKLNLKENSNG